MSSTDGNLSEDSFTVDVEINDLEYDIPPVGATPSLESVLWDLDNEERSNDSGSLSSVPGVLPKLNSVLSHCTLQGITTQTNAAGERVDGGIPTVLANGRKFIAVGTSHGYVLAFDSSQKLCWCCKDSQTNDQGAVSALAFNYDSSRLLVGYERGYISMVDTHSGDVIRRLPDAHAPQSAVLHLRYTDLTELALCGDSAGCVFSLSFGRRLGVRTWDSKCLFSGARGEVCISEPLVIPATEHPLRPNVLVALATLSKIIVISIRPRLKVIFTHVLPRLPTLLPLISWQLVAIQTVNNIKITEPVLAFGRGSNLHFYRVHCSSHGRKIRLSLLRHVHLNYDLLSMHWLGYRHLALIDTSETVRLMDVRTQKELESLDISEVGLVYGSAHFKALATGGQVSAAFALAGERACYNSIVSRGNQLLILGMKSVEMIRLRTWDERLQFLSNQNRWAEALNLASEEANFKKDFDDSSSQVLLNDFVSIVAKNGCDRESLQAAIKCCVKLKKIQFLCGYFWESINTETHLNNWYFQFLTDHICQGELTYLNTSVAQALVTFHVEEGSLKTLENLLLALEIDCLDLNQVLKICKKYSLYDAWIHFVTKAMEDYTAPIIELIPKLTPDNHTLGNTILVYISSCLAGLAYPVGKIHPSLIAKVKHDVFRSLTVIHSNCAKENELPYPYLRTLLKYNTREFLNVIELAFSEAEFSGELGKIQRQRTINILLQIVQPPEFEDVQIINLTCFVSRLITNGMLVADKEILDVVIKTLTSMIEKPLNLRDHQEREQAWLDLMMGQKLDHIAPKELLEMAIRSKCYRVCEILYENSQKFNEILNCYLNDIHRQNEVFSYMRTHIDDPSRSVKVQMVKNVERLLDIDKSQTAQLIVDHFGQKLEEICEKLRENPEKLFSLLSEIQNFEFTLSPELSEHYFELLCAYDPTSVENFIKTGSCRPERALEISQKTGHKVAAAYFLEQIGDFNQAIEILLENPSNENILRGSELCTRSVLHLDQSQVEKLWLKLINSCNDQELLRQILHLAAQFVSLSTLLNVINKTNLGDIKNLLEGLLSDAKHETLMLETTYRLLGYDLHHGLAKSLSKGGQGISIKSTICNFCKTNLVDDEMIAIFSCGHVFHKKCLNIENFDSNDSLTCQKCQNSATFINISEPKNQYDEKRKNLLPELKDV